MVTTLIRLTDHALQGGRFMGANYTYCALILECASTIPLEGELLAIKFGFDIVTIFKMIFLFVNNLSCAVITVTKHNTLELVRLFF